MAENFQKFKIKKNVLNTYEVANVYKISIKIFKKY